MAKFLSGRQKNLKIGISSYSENLTSLEVIGKVGIGSTVFNPVADLDIRGSLNVRDTINAQIFNVETNTESLITNKATINGNLYVSGIGTITTLRSNSGIVTNISGTNLNYSGISTLGLTSTTDLTSQQLVVSGLSTFSGITTHTTSLFGTQASFTGVVTASSFRGDGSQLTGVTGTQVVSQPFTSTPVFPILASNSGVSSVGIATTGPNALVFIPSSGNLGIGTTNPTSKLDVRGDVLVSGIITASSFVGTALSISGISTLGGLYGVVIKSDGSNGIVTSANPGVSTVTYYGDGSKLTGIGSATSATNVVLTTDTSSTTTNIVFSQTPNQNPTSSLKTNPGLIFDASTSSLGIGTTNPTSKLWVNGDGYFVGVITANKFSGQLDAASAQAQSVGFATTATNLAGGTTGNVPYQSNAGITTFVTNPGVSGKVLLFNGSVPVWGDVSSASGSFGGISVQDESSPVGTSGNITTLNFVGANIRATATTGANGIATITIADNLVGTALSISGISTFGGSNGVVIKLDGSNGIVTSANPGVSTVTYYGDGSKLSNIISGVSISTNTSNQSQYLTYTTGTGSTTGFGVTTSGLVFNPSSGNLGIGTTNPTSKLWVNGDGYFVGVITANKFSGQLDAASAQAQSVGFATTATNLAGGTTGNVPYQSNAGITTFVTNPGVSGKVLLFNGSVPVWGDVSSASGSFGGISVQDETSPVGTSNSITTLNFVGANIRATATTGANGIATITIADNLVGTALSISGISTFTNGPVLIGGGTSTGTASQRLQVTGGAYVSGDVGIGTTNPTTKLDVNGDIRLRSGLYDSNDFIGDFNSILISTGSDVIWSTLGELGGSDITIQEDNNTLTPQYLVFTNVTSGSSYTEKVSPTKLTYIASSGNLGIGTSNPSTPLQVERYGVKTGFGTFVASAGITTDVDNFLISDTNFRTAEYTVHIQSSSSIQAQKVLVMQNGTSAFSQEYAIMYDPTFMVSIGATVSGGRCKLQFTPESGISGLMTYRFTRETLL